MASPTVPPQTFPGGVTFGVAEIGTRIASTLTTNGAVNLDASAGNLFVVTLQANATSTVVSNAIAGQRITIKYIQDATGSRTYVWPANAKFGTGVTTGTTVAAGAPTDSTASKSSTVTFEYDGTNLYEVSRSVAVG